MARSFVPGFQSFVPGVQSFVLAALLFVSAPVIAQDVERAPASVAAPAPAPAPAPEPALEPEPAPAPAPAPAPVPVPVPDPAPVPAPAARLPLRPPPAAQLLLEPQSPLRIHGFLQNQTGVFISTDKTVVGPDRFPLDHGDKLGTLSILRNSFVLEGDWHALDWLDFHVTLRGVLSWQLSADRDAQVPLPGYYGRADRSIDWVCENYYNEASVREAYADIDATRWLSFRIGRQFVAWGETGQIRLLDVVNPVDSTWHFSTLEGFEEQRIPLWIVRAMAEIPVLSGGLEIVWAPLIDRKRDTVDVPLTFVGAWGLPPPPRQGDESQALWKIRKKVFDYPGHTLGSSRIGARWRGTAGPLTYSLLYYYTHQITTPVPTHYVERSGQGDESLDVYAGFPRQHIAGFSLEGNLPFPVSTQLKFEGVVEPDRTYALHSLAPRPLPKTLENGDQVVFLGSRRKPTLSYALTVQQPALLRFLNPREPVNFTLQFVHSFLPTFDAADQLVEVPGYDSTRMRQNQFRLGGSIFTTYLNGLLTPKVTGAWMYGGGGFVSGSLAVSPGDHWRFVATLTGFFGSDPYYQFGMFRDRDEASILVRYQF